jgi:hypothetical protein
MFGSDSIEVIDGALHELGQESRAGWSEAAQSERVVDLARIAERSQAEMLRAVGQWDAEGLWAADGALSATSWLVTHTTMSRAEANRVVRAARLLREHGATASAVASGAVSCSHVDLLAAATRNREDLYPEGEQGLLTHAATLNADRFAIVVRRWRSLADDEMANQDAYAVHERRYLHASKTLGGTRPHRRRARSRGRGGLAQRPRSGQRS